MALKPCLFCYGEVYIDINSYCGKDHTVKDDILEFFGHQIEDRLYSDDGVCNFCMTLMDALARLKRRLIPLIYREDVDFLDPVNFRKKYEIFTLLSYDEHDNEPYQGSRSSTPNLVRCKSIVPYNSPLERRLAEVERYRSESRISVRSARSDTCSEIVDAFARNGNKRKRKKGHNWARRKNGKYSRASNISRADTGMSARPPSTHLSWYNNNFDVDELSSAPQLTFKIGPNEQKKPDELIMVLNEVVIRQCTQDECDFTCEDLDSLVKHKMTEHKCLALYWCDNCDKRYTSSAELGEHKQSHVEEELVCDVCHLMFTLRDDLNYHYEEVHLKHSVACPLCNRRFVNKKSCDKHMKCEHNDEKLRRIDFCKQQEPVNVGIDSFQVRFLVQTDPEPDSKFTL